MQLGEINSNQFDNQYLFFENYQQNNLIKIRNDLKVYFEKIDQEIFLSSWRKDKGYIPDGFKARTIITIYGSITYKRRIYKYWDETRYRYVFLADKKLQIEKYNRVTNHLKFKILEQMATGKRQRDICDMFYYANITRSTVSNIMKLSNFQTSLKYLVRDIAKVKIDKYLYINMDETFIKLRRNKKMWKYRIRLVTFHTGYNEIYSTEKRKVLNNKRVYCQLLPISKKVNTAKFMQTLKRVAKKFYSNVDDIKVVICGDGATWIREANNYWSNSCYILDKFHAVRYLRQLFPSANSEIYQISKNLFTLGEFNGLMHQLKQINVSSTKAEKLVRIINYFANNAFGVNNQKMPWNIGVSVEGDVSHIVKWLLGYGSKAFNYQTFKNMLLLKAAEINKIDMIGFLKKEDQLAKQAIKNFYWKNYWVNRENIRFFSI